MSGSERASVHWVRAHPALTALIAYVILALVFLWPGLLPGHTVSAADYLWNVAPWNTIKPGGLPIQSLHPLFVGSNPQVVDGVTVFEPYLQYTASQLPHVPLWNPYIMGGMPYLADMQSAIFSPFSLPAYFLPFWWSLGAIALMKIVVAAMGTYLLGRVLGLRPAGAFLAGLVFGFSLFMVAWIPWPLTNVFPLIPWALLATERVVRRPGPLAVGALAAVVGLQFFGGHPETSIYVILAIGGWFVLRLFQGPGGAAAAIGAAAARGESRIRALWQRAWRPLLALVLALGVGTALAAVVIVPFLQLLGHSSDLTTRPRAGVHVPPNQIFAGLLPRYFPQTFDIETAFYIGALPLMLALAALLRPRVDRVVLAVVAAVSLLVVLGIQPFFFVAGHTPGLDETYLSRLTIIAVLCLALLAGAGMDDVMAGRLRGRRAGAAVAIALVLLLLPVLVVATTRSTALTYLGDALKIAFLFHATPLPHAPHVDEVVRLTALVVWLTVAGIAVVLLCLRLSGRLAPVLFAVLGVVLVVGDLFQAGMGYNPAIPTSHAVQPATASIRYLQRQGTARFVAVTPYGGFNPIPPDVAVRYRLYDLRGYDLPVISRFGVLWRRYVSPPNPLLPLNTPSVPLDGASGLSPQVMRVLSLFGVRSVLEAVHTEPIGVPGLELVRDGPDAKVYRNMDALPRTWLVAGQNVVHSGSAALREIVAADFDPHTTVVTEQRLPNLSSSTSSVGSSGTASIVHYGPEQVVISAHATRASELVLSDVYYPGWTATVNGRTVPISEVDYLIRGVAVPAGDDRIVFTYAPASFRTGWHVSLAAAIVLVVAVAIGTLRLRRRPDRPRGARRRHARGRHAPGVASTAPRFHDAAGDVPP